MDFADCGALNATFPPSKHRTDESSFSFKLTNPIARSGCIAGTKTDYEGMRRTADTEGKVPAKILLFCLSSSLDTAFLQFAN